MQEEPHTRFRPPIHVRHTGRELPQIIDASFKILPQLPIIAGPVASFLAASAASMGTPQPS